VASVAPSRLKVICSSCDRCGKIFLWLEAKL